MPDYSVVLSAKNRNKHDTMVATHTTNKRFPDVMAANTKLGSRNVELGTVVTNVDTWCTDRDEFRKGKADEKDQVFSELVTVGSKAAAAGRSLARDLKDQSIFEICNYSKSKLADLKGGEVVPVFSGIQNVVNNHIERMPEFGFTAVKAELFNSKFIAYKDKYGDLKADLSASSATTKKIQDEIDKGMAILEDMDDLVDAIQDEYPDYYNQYKASRVIHDLGGQQQQTVETPA